MEKDAAGYPQGHTNPGTSRTSPATYPTSRAVLRGGGGGNVTSLPDTWVGNHPGLPGPPAAFCKASCSKSLFQKPYVVVRLRGRLYRNRSRYFAPVSRRSIN